jgi:hypothetical protein
MVCLSRISPIRMQSGACRSAFFSAVSKLLVSVPTSRWLTIDFLFCEDELDRVFQRQDVARLLLVAQVEHRRQRRRLARAGRADHQDQAALLHDDFLQHVRQPSVSNSARARDEAHHHGGRALLRKALMRNAPTPSSAKAVFSSISSSYSLICFSLSTS